MGKPTQTFLATMLLCFLRCTLDRLSDRLGVWNECWNMAVLSQKKILYLR